MRNDTESRINDHLERHAHGYALVCKVIGAVTIGVTLNRYGPIAVALVVIAALAAVLGLILSEDDR